MEISESFLHTALTSLKRDILTSLRGMMPGRVLTYDASSGLASVQPGLCRKTASGEILPAPVLSGVPVFLPSAGFSPAPGDACLLLFADFCLDAWLATSGEAALPPSPRAHDLSDAIALAGYFPAVNHSL